jgi:hypothetical protein
MDKRERAREKQKSCQVSWHRLSPLREHPVEAGSSVKPCGMCSARAALCLSLSRLKLGRCQVNGAGSSGGRPGPPAPDFADGASGLIAGALLKRPCLKRL